MAGNQKAERLYDKLESTLQLRFPAMTHYFFRGSRTLFIFEKLTRAYLFQIAFQVSLLP